MASKKNICPWCGIANPEDAGQCISCGSDLNPAPAVSAEAPIAPGKELPAAAKSAPQASRPPASQRKTAGAQPKKERKDNTPGPIRPGYVYAAIAAVVFLGYLYMTNDRPSGSPDVPQNTSLTQTDSTGERIRSMEEYLRSHPDDLEAKLAYANTLHDARQFPKAIAAYKNYLIGNPKNPDARVDMAICLFESGDSPTAIVELKKALDYAPKHQAAMFNLGVVYMNQEKMQESNDWFSRCAAADPGTPLAARAKQLLSQHSLTNKNPK